MPRIHRKTPDTEAPTTPVTECSVESSSSTGPASAFTPTESRNASRNTIVEWPRQNQKPDRQRLADLLRRYAGDSRSTLSAISLRVVLSTAAMWSASKACRRPKV